MYAVRFKLLISSLTYIELFYLRGILVVSVDMHSCSNVDIVNACMDFCHRFKFLGSVVDKLGYVIQYGDGQRTG